MLILYTFFTHKFKIYSIKIPVGRLFEDKVFLHLNEKQYINNHLSSLFKKIFNLFILNIMKIFSKAMFDIAN